MNYKKLQKIEFPQRSGVSINMMPIIMGYPETIPEYLHGYLPLIQECSFEKGKIVFLTIDERDSPPQKSQRRPGIHTEAGATMTWGGGSWGGQKFGKSGIYMTSTDGACKIWDTQTQLADLQGRVLIDLPDDLSFECEPNVLYWMTDRTPHEALPSEKDRQFFRLVGPEVSMWYSKHSTPNPLGVEPNCKIIDEDKFVIFGEKDVE